MFQIILVIILIILSLGYYYFFVYKKKIKQDKFINKILPSTQCPNFVNNKLNLQNNNINLQNNNLNLQNNNLNNKLEEKINNQIQNIIDDIDKKVALQEPEFIKKREIQQKKTIENSPEINNLHKLLLEFKSNINKWDCLIAIADIYRKGSFPRYLPNEDLAIKCYKVAAQCPDGNIAGLAQTKYIEARTDKINNEDRQGVEFPINYGIEALQIAENRIVSIHWSLFEKPKMQKIQSERHPIIKNNKINNNTQEEWTTMFDFEQDIENMFNFNINNISNLNNTPEVYKHDSQNVHDHSVVSIAKKNLESISNNIQNNNTKQDIINKVRNSILINQDLNNEETSNALLVLENLTTKKHSQFNKTEIDILVDVWNKIDNENNLTLKNNLIETLGKQLASGVENGSVVCSTGKIIRILGTLDGIEDKIIETTKPIWILKEEIAQLASKVRDDLLDKLNSSQIIAYNEGKNPELDEKMRTTFRKLAEETYYNKLNMNKKIIDPIIQLYEDAF